MNLLDLDEPGTPKAARCRCCKRLLRAEESLGYVIGPVCRKRLGITPQPRVRLARTKPGGDCQGQTDTTPPRSFAVDSLGNATSLSTEERVTLMGVSASASAAYDLLTDDGVPAEQAAKMTLAAQKSGRDPEAFARHFLKLRRGLRASEGATP